MLSRFGVGLLAAASLALGAEPFYLHDGDHVVFYGDSITDQRLYTVLTETFVVTRYPKLKVEFTHSGWGGDRVSGGGGGPIDTRLNRDVFPYRPTVMTIMLGMNDGGYRAESEANDRVFFDGYRHIVESVREHVPGVRITAIQPSPFDDVTRAPNFPGGYNEVLRSFSKWIANYAKTEHLEVADLNTGVVEMLRRANELDAAKAAMIIPDRVHPRFAGHLVMAEQLLKAWRARPVVSEISIDAGGKGETSLQEHSTVSKLQRNGKEVRWTALDDALPLPMAQWETMGDAGSLALVYKSSDLAEALNRQVVRVTGLEPGTYALTIDGEPAATHNDNEWARGINIGLLDTPMSRQAKQVFDLTVQHCDLHNSRWRQVQVPLSPLELPGTQAAMQRMDELETQVVQKRAEASSPKAHEFVLHPVS